jgi:hypothetical protein
VRQSGDTIVLHFRLTHGDSDEEVKIAGVADEQEPLSLQESAFDYEQD